MEGGSGLRYHTTTYCGMFVWAGSARCNPQGVAITTCRSSADAFFQSANTLFAEPALAPKSLQPNKPALAELQTCGFYDASSAAAYCQANPLQFCCRSVPGFQAPSGVTSSAGPTAASTPVAAANSSSAATDQKIFGMSLPIFIGAVVGGTVVIAIVVGILLCTRRRSRRASVYNNAAKGGQNDGAGVPDGMGANNGYYKEDDYGNGGYGQQQQQQQQNDYRSPPPPSSALPQAPGMGSPMMSGNEYGQSSMGDMGMGGAMAGGAMAGGAMAGGPPTGVNVAGEDTMEAIFNYVPNLSDEVYLYVGDPVIVKCTFDDGWAYGYNVTTQQEGSFPIACVGPPGTNPNVNRDTYAQDDQMGAPADPNRSSFNIRQRQSSMFGPPPGFRETMYTEAAMEENGRR
ncbi:hypothetical protein BC829DRAFT_439750 [Chytridium lagenaria]|nr:hypothetical protein BC829DRAFT_439750 [Chytridium lagenaria]